MMYKCDINELTTEELATIKEVYKVSEEQLAEDMELNNLVQIFENIRGYLNWMYIEEEEYEPILAAFLDGKSAEDLVKSDGRCTMFNGKVIFYNE